MNKMLPILICAIVIVSIFRVPETITAFNWEASPEEGKTSIVPMGSPVVTEGGIIYVDDDANPGWYNATHVRTIKEGIKNASSGNTVFVYSGTYFEHITINKTIHLMGENKTTTIIDATSSKSRDGIEIKASRVNISNFTIRNCYQGYPPVFPPPSAIKIFDKNKNTIKDNIITNNNNGFWLDCSSNNIITGNTIKDSSDYGIYIECSHYPGSSKNNSIYHNNFINNTENAADYGITNSWDNGYPDGGNYWSDYTGIDADGDGIGDTPYNISGGDNQDRYPLMAPFKKDEEDEEPPHVEITVPQNGLYLKGQKIIPFFTIIIIKSIDIEVNASDLGSGIARVEFFIDDDLQANVSSEPFRWAWSEKAFFRHTIKVTAYDKAGNHQSKEMSVWKFL